MEDNLASTDYEYVDTADDNSALPVPPPILGNLIAKTPAIIEQEIEELDATAIGFIQTVVNSFKSRPVMTAITFALVSFALVLSLTLVVLITQHIT